jgi:hypothetical protein
VATLSREALIERMRSTTEWHQDVLGGGTRGDPGMIELEVMRSVHDRVAQAIDTKKVDDRDMVARRYVVFVLASFGFQIPSVYLEYFGARLPAVPLWMVAIIPAAA